MTKRGTTILSSFSMLLVSIILLLIYFIFKPSYASLTFKASNVTLYVGQSVYNFYEISKEAELTFEVSDNNIIDINSERILALNIGSVSVNILAKIDDQIYKTTFNVTVLNYTYSFKITTIDGCEYKDNILYSYSDNNIFNVEILDKDGSKLSNLKYNYNCQNAIL